MSRSKRKSSSDIAGTTRKCQIMMETKVKIIESGSRHKHGHSFLQHESFNHQHDSKEQGTCEILMMKTSKKQGKVREEMEKLLSV